MGRAKLKISSALLLQWLRLEGFVVENIEMGEFGTSVDITFQSKHIPDNADEMVTQYKRNSESYELDEIIYKGAGGKRET